MDALDTRTKRFLKISQGESNLYLLDGNEILLLCEPGLLIQSKRRKLAKSVTSYLIMWPVTWGRHALTGCKISLCVDARGRWTSLDLKEQRPWDIYIQVPMKRVQCWTREKAPWTKCLLCKHRDLSSDPQHPHKNPVRLGGGGIHFQFQHSRITPLIPELLRQRQDMIIWGGGRISAPFLDREKG